MSRIMQILTLLSLAILPVSCNSRAVSAAYGDATIRGTVTDQNGNPVDHLSIHVMDKNRELVRATFTGADGTYQADRLRSGESYDVAAASISQELARRIKVPAGSNSADLKVSLRKISGKVLLPNGSPAPTAHVVASSVDWAIDRETFTDKGGNFVLEQLPPALMELSAEVDRLPKKTISVNVSKTEQALLRIDAPASLVVTVLEQTSKQPLPFVEINIGEQIAQVLRYRNVGQTDANGQVAITDARPGTASLMVSSPLHQQPAVDVELTSGVPSRIILLADRSCKLIGSIDVPNQNDVENAIIMAEPLSLLPTHGIGYYTGAFSAGHFSIATPPGTYKIHAIIGLRPPRTKEIISSSPASIQLESKPITLQRGQTAIADLHKLKR